MLTLLFIASNILFDITSSSDFCAFGHAVAPSNNNIGDTHNWINGEFNRDTTFVSGGQSDLFLGRPYYKMIQPSKCFVPVLYLFRHINSHVYPAVNTWVIAGGMGTSPEESYAYCTIASDLQDTPDGNCDGQWKVKKDSSTFMDDSEFVVRVGGCPQVKCQSLSMYSRGKLDWLTDYRTTEKDWVGTFAYSEPNIYKQINNNRSDNAADGGTFYLFWNYKAWMWAIHSYIDKYSECDSYKTQEFTYVSNVIGGSYINSMPEDNGVLGQDEFDFSINPYVVYVVCSGTLVTPDPTAQDPHIPSKAPVDINWCSDTYNNGGQVAPSIQYYIDLYCNTPSPVVPQTFTNDPTRIPSVSPTDPTLPPVKPPTGVTPGPTPGPTVPKGSPSNDPTLRPTPGPTVTAGNPSNPPTARPNDGVGQDDGTDGTDDDGGEDGGDYGNKINCNMYLICVVVALYKLLF